MNGKDVEQDDIDLACQEPGDQGSATVIGDVLQLDVGRIHQQFGRNMAEGADAVAAVIQLAGVFLGVADEILRRVDRKARIDGKDRLAL